MSGISKETMFYWEKNDTSKFISKKLLEVNKEIKKNWISDQSFIENQRILIVLKSKRKNQSLLFIYNSSNGKLLKKLKTSLINKIRFSPDIKNLLVTYQNGKNQLFNSNDNYEKVVLTTHENVIPDSSWANLIIARKKGKSLKPVIYNLNTNISKEITELNKLKLNQVKLFKSSLIGYSKSNMYVFNYQTKKLSKIKYFKSSAYKIKILNKNNLLIENKTSHKMKTYDIKNDEEKCSLFPNSIQTTESENINYMVVNNKIFDINNCETVHMESFLVSKNISFEYDLLDEKYGIVVLKPKKLKNEIFKKGHLILLNRNYSKIFKNMSNYNWVYDYPYISNLSDFYVKINNMDEHNYLNKNYIHTGEKFYIIKTKEKNSYFIKDIYGHKVFQGNGNIKPSKDKTKFLNRFNNQAGYQLLISIKKNKDDNLSTINNLTNKYGNSFIKFLKKLDKKTLDIARIYGLQDSLIAFEEKGFDFLQNSLKKEKPTRPPYPISSVYVDKEFFYEEQPFIKIKVKNKGKDSIYRLKATVQSNSDLLSYHTIIFGEIKPGEEVERKYYFKKASAKHIGKNIPFQISFNELNDNIPQSVAGILKIANVNQDIIAERIFNQNIKYDKERLLDLYEQKIVNLAFIQNLIIRKTEMFNYNDILHMINQKIPLRKVVDKITIYSKIKFSEKEIVTLSDLNSISKETIEYLINKKNYHFNKEQIMRLAINNSISKYTVDALYKKKAVVFDRFEIKKLYQINKLSKIEILYTYKIIDDGSGGSVGNGDGRIQKGEGIDFSLSIRNAGIFNIKNLKLKLKSPGKSLAINDGQKVFHLKTEPDGKLLSNFIIKRTLATKFLKFSIAMNHELYGKILNDEIKIPLDIKPAQQILAIKKKVISKKRVKIYGGADTKTSIIAYSNKGSVLQVTGEINKMLRVKIGKLNGWISKNEIKDYTNEVDSNLVREIKNQLKSNSSKEILKAYENTKPEIFILSPTNNTKIKNFNAKVMVEARDRNSNIKSIMIKVNGKPVIGSGNRGLKIIKSGHKVRESYNIKLSKGINYIKVVAYNKKGLASDEEIVKVIALGSNFKPKLWLLSIGVSNYKNNNYNLKYAAKDAKTIVNVFKKQQRKGLYEKVNYKLLVNKSVTRLNVLKEVNTFLTKASTDDVIVIFFAGHGITSSNGKYYFMTYDADFKNPGIRGISESVLKDDIIKNSVSDKSIFMFDTCHSGKIAKLTRGNVDLDQVVENLRNGTGQFIMSASRGNEYAYEHVKWKNGAFTKAIKDGLYYGKADIDKDGFIDVFEFQKDINDIVPLITKGKQHPKTTNINFDNIRFFIK